MTDLRVVLDPVLQPGSDGVARYAEELTRALIASAPRGTEVAGVVSASPESDYETIAQRLPGLSELYKSPLARRELRAAWQHGFTRLPGAGIVHSMSLLAPLYRHERGLELAEQVVVTIHDAIPWTHPEWLPTRDVSWAKGMAKRAERYADAVVVPSHAVAAELAEHLSFGDRVRVIGAAPSTSLRVPADADDRAADLALPERYLLAVASTAPHSGLDALVRALRDPATDDVPLIVVGEDSTAAGSVDVAALVEELGLDEGRVRRFESLEDPELATLYSRASVVVVPSLAAGFGPTMIEAFAHGVPVVHSDAAALTEVAAGAGLEVALDASPTDAGDDGDDGYSGRLAAAIGRVLDEGELRSRLVTLGSDRVGTFSWRDAAEKVWQLHADL